MIRLSTLVRAIPFVALVRASSFAPRACVASQFLPGQFYSMATASNNTPIGVTADALPPLSPADFQIYDSMAQHMQYFHENFRRTWNLIYASCTASGPQSLSASRLISTGLSFVHHLEIHHGIEEQHIFPVLAQRMDSFKADAMTGPLEDHRQIHVGMDKLGSYLKQCQSGERSLRREEVKGILDSFGAVLWSHLEDEVKQLGAENMRKFWSTAEMQRMPM